MKSSTLPASPSFSTNAPSALSHEQIAYRAQALWQQMGFPQDSDEAIWFEAERQLREHEPLDPADSDEVAFADPQFLFSPKSNSMMAQIDALFPGSSGRETTSL